MIALNMKLLSSLLSLLLVVGMIGGIVGVMSSVSVLAGDSSESSDSSSDSGVPPDQDRIESIDPFLVTKADMYCGYVTDGEGNYRLAYHLDPGILYENTVYKLSWEIRDGYESTGAYILSDTNDEGLTEYYFLLDPSYVAYEGFDYKMPHTDKQYVLANSVTFTSGSSEDLFAFFLFEYSAPTLEEADVIRCAVDEYVSKIELQVVDPSYYGDKFYKESYREEDFDVSLISFDTNHDGIKDYHRIAFSIGPNVDSKYILKSGYPYTVSWEIDPAYSELGLSFLEHPSPSGDGFIETHVYIYVEDRVLDEKIYSVVVQENEESVLKSGAGGLRLSTDTSDLYITMFELSGVTYQEALSVRNYLKENISSYVKLLASCETN